MTITPGEPADTSGRRDRSRAVSRCEYPDRHGRKETDAMRTSIVPPWISGYKSKWLTKDVIAGLTIAGILVPEGMAYAQVAGVVDAVGADRIFMSDATAAASFASRTGATRDPDAVAAEAAAALGELAGLLDDDEVSRRLQRAIEALDTDAE